MASDVGQALVLRMEASLTRFERQMARARGVGREAATGIQRDFDRMNTRMAASSARAAQGMGSFLNVSRAGRFVMQNTAAQIGDVAVQLESGTSAMRVAGQQLPQILGGFGALGGAVGILAPLLGTVAAVALPVAAGFLAMGNNAGSAADRIEAAADAVEEVGNRTGALRSGTSDLRNLEDQLAQAILLRGINQQAVSEASITALTAEIEARRAMIDLERFQTQAAIRAAQERVAALQAEADQIVANARGIGLGLTEVNPGASQQEVAVAMRRVVEETQAYLAANEEVFLQLSAQEAELAAQEAILQAVNTVMADTDGVAANLVATLEGADLSGIVAQAQALAERLGISAAAANSIAGMLNAESLGGASGPDSALNQVREDGRFDESTVVFRGTFGSLTSPDDGGGRSGSGSSEMTEAMRVAAQIIREVQQETLTLADLQAALNAELQAGRLSTEEYDAAMAAAVDRFSGANAELRTMGDLLAQMAVNWENAGDIAVSALRRITQQLLSRALTQGLERLASGPSGGVLSTIARGLFGGGVPFGGARASGGPVSAGKAYLVGERGPELIVPQSAGTVFPTPPAMAASGGGGGGVDIRITNMAPDVEVQRAGSGRGADGRQFQQLVVRQMRQSLANGELDGAMGRYGARVAARPK